MNDITQQSVSREFTQVSDSERTKQVTIAGWTAGASAFFATGALAGAPSWPLAVGVVAVSAMVAVACYFILKTDKS